MDVGAFMMPNHPPGRDFGEGHEHDLDTLAFLDRIGFAEAWIGCHYTVPTEPCPAPDLLVAQALLRTERIRVSPGGYMLPFHHPAELAHRIAWLDHIGRGRCYIGVGSSGIPTDWLMFDIDGFAGQNREMTEESLDIMMRFWESDGPFEYRGKYWTARRPEGVLDGNYGYHIGTFTKPHPQIAIAGFSPDSPTLVLAGRRGFIPLSLSYSDVYLAGHWASVERGAAEAGRTPDRNAWRIGRDIYVAETDAEAWDKVVNGAIGAHYRSFWLPVLKHIGMLSACKHHPDVADSDVTVEYIAEHCMAVGSPRTVERKVAAMLEASGGFGTLLVISYDHLDDMEGWRDSMRALAGEVMPAFADVAAAGDRVAR